MKIHRILCLWALCALFWIPQVGFAEPNVLVESAPNWNVGDSWSYRIDKKLDRTVTQNAGMVQISMTLQKVESDLTHTVTGIGEVEGEKCYLVQLAGSSNIKGTYSTGEIMEGEAAGGTLLQQTKVEGTEYRRVSDLAFLKAEIRSKGTIQLGGVLAGVSTPYETQEIVVANPPAQMLQFPLVEGKKWNVSSALSATASGTASDSSVTTFNYECEVLGRQTVTLENGESYDAVLISQKGTQTTQSQNSGINIEDVKGTLFYVPELGNRVKDEAEGEVLVSYIKGEPPVNKAIDP